MRRHTLVGISYDENSPSVALNFDGWGAVLSRELHNGKYLNMDLAKRLKPGDDVLIEGAPDDDPRDFVNHGGGKVTLVYVQDKADHNKFDLLYVLR
ncbi:MAG: hypothetical protein KGH55_01675 [Nanoarchaeota archaeon]|nr:hypothetical protein [Nanoarchaeota archaeon]